MVESELVSGAFENLRRLLPDYFTIEQTYDPDPDIDARWQLTPPEHHTVDLLVEAKLSLRPRDAQRLAEKKHAAPLLVAAPWLSQRTREVLETHNISYLDLTGNVLLRIERPAVFVHLHGANRDPAPPPRSVARLQGPKARRLARVLAEHTPPYGLTGLATLTGLSQGYVSRLLDALNDEALIDRPRRGDVLEVDWPAVLGTAAEQYVPLRSSSALTYMSPNGAARAYDELKLSSNTPLAVTGAFAARAIAPVAGAAQLVVYCEEPEELRKAARLVPADQNADVVLLRPDDPWILQGLRRVDGVPHVALSQLVLDCANGPGRLPEQGEAVLEWMKNHESSWRMPIIAPEPLT